MHSVGAQHVAPIHPLRMTPKLFLQECEKLAGGKKGLLQSLPKEKLFYHSKLRIALKLFLQECEKRAGGKKGLLQSLPKEKLFYHSKLRIALKLLLQECEKRAGGKKGLLQSLQKQEVFVRAIQGWKPAPLQKTLLSSCVGAKPHSLCLPYLNAQAQHKS